MGDPVPVRVAGPRTVVRYCPSTRIPLPSHAAAAACLATSGPPAIRHPPRRALSVCPDTTGTAPRPARHVAPRPGSRHAGQARQARGPSRALAASLAVSCTLPPRALPRGWRTGAYAMRRPPMLLRCSEALAQLQFAAFTRRARRPGNVASGDRCVRGTLAPRHHAGTNNLLSKAPGATGRKAALAPRHYRIPPTGRHAAGAAIGRFQPPAGSDGALRLRPPARRTPLRRTSSSRWRRSPPCRAGRGSPSAGRSGRSRRPATAPASRCRGRPPAAPSSSRGPPARQDRRTRSRPPPRAAPARRGAMRGRDADEPAPHVLRANDIDVADSMAAAGRPPSREPMAMSAGRASRADGRKSLAGCGAADGVPERGAAVAPHQRHHGARHGPADHRESHQTVHRHQHPPRRPRGRSTPRGQPRHRPVRGRNRRNAAMARRPRVNTPAADPEAAFGRRAVYVAGTYAAVNRLRRSVRRRRAFGESLSGDSLPYSIPQHGQRLVQLVVQVGLGRRRHGDAELPVNVVQLIARVVSDLETAAGEMRDTRRCRDAGCGVRWCPRRRVRSWGRP